MKALLPIFVFSMLAGCVVRNHHHHGKGTSARRGDKCGPAYHWNGYKCVHNGNGRARGHRK